MITLDGQFFSMAGGGVLTLAREAERIRHPAMWGRGKRWEMAIPDASRSLEAQVREYLEKHAPKAKWQVDLLANDELAVTAAGTVLCRKTSLTAWIGFIGRQGSIPPAKLASFDDLKPWLDREVLRDWRAFEYERDQEQKRSQGG